MNSFRVIFRMYSLIWLSKYQYLLLTHLSTMESIKSVDILYCHLNNFCCSCIAAKLADCYVWLRRQLQLISCRGRFYNGNRCHKWRSGSFMQLIRKIAKSLVLQLHKVLLYFYINDVYRLILTHQITHIGKVY